MNAYDMGKHAYSTVPLYYNLAEKRQLNIENISFVELPIVDKGFYADSGMSMISSRYIPDYMNQELRYTRTSGSTGKFSEVYWKQEDYNRSLVSLWIWRKKYYQITPRDRMAYFFPADQGETGYVVLEHALALSRNYLSNGNLENAYEKILEYDPVWMILQPNLALLLSNIAEECGEIPESLRYIEFTGEFLEIPVRQQIEKVFQCITANQYSAMPFVRFNLEDRGRIIRSKPCSCGRCTDALELYAGRSNDWIQCKDGTRIHAYALIQIIHQANYEMDGQIVQYQIIQHDFDTFEVVLMLDETEVLPVLSEYVIKRFREKLGEVEVVVHLTDGLIPSERTGKLADFVSNAG